MLYIRRMAATVKKMPMAPVLCLLMSAVNMTLRLRRYNISTSVDGEKSVPFRGYSADFDAPCGWSGGGKSILLECLGAPLIQSVLGELLRVEEKGMEGEFWPEFAQRLSYLELENRAPTSLRNGNEISSFSQNVSQNVRFGSVVSHPLPGPPRSTFVSSLPLARATFKVKGVSHGPPGSLKVPLVVTGSPQRES